MSDKIPALIACMATGALVGFGIGIAIATGAQDPDIEETCRDAAAALGATLSVEHSEFRVASGYVRDGRCWISTRTPSGSNELYSLERAQKIVDSITREHGDK